MRRLIIALALVASSVAPSARAQECADRVDDAAFASAAQLEAWNQVMADFGSRPTASPNHAAFIDWIEDRLAEIPGLQLSTLDDAIDRWLVTGTALTLHAAEGDEAVPVAAAVPYSKAASVSGGLVGVPAATPIDNQDDVADFAGKIILRDVVPGVIQLPVFFAVAYYVHDPGLTFDYLGNYERDWISAVQRGVDLEAAAAEGAAGIVFVHELPHAQVEGDYHPYEGKFWDVPAVYVGVDEGERLKAAAGAAADLTVSAEQTPSVPTRTVFATLPGGSLGEQRIAVASHTDGVNAVWDNGPIGILALAKYFASLPIECRPRTIQFAFTTAHLYLSHIGAGRYAELLDADYDEGTVAFAVALEHLGAKEFVAMERPSGPGRELVSTGNSELFAVFVHESPATLQAVARSVIERDLRRTFILRGADAPAVRFPPHHSYGGEGGPYHQRLIPTVAAITGPATLFKPAFAMDALLDVDLMRRQTMAFGDVVLRLHGLPREVIAGADTVYRVGREATG